MPMPTELQNEMAEREAALDAAQVNFLPAQRPVGRLTRVRADLIDVPESTPAADSDMVESIRALGVIQPVAIRVYPVGAPGYPNRCEIIAGRRRVLAAREAGVTMIPVIVYEADVPAHVIAAMTLTENYMRRANPLAELEAIERLVAEGASEADIAEQIGISRQTLTARMRLGRLIPELRDLLANQMMGAAVADLAARLDVRRQRDLYRLWTVRNETNSPGVRARITANDVRSMREAVRQEVTASLPDSMFSTPTRPTVLLEDRIAELTQQIANLQADAREADLAAMNEISILQSTVVNRDRTIEELNRLTTDLRREAVDLRTRLHDQIRITREASSRPQEAATPASLPEGWASVFTLLQSAIAAVPVAPDPFSESAYQKLQDMLDDVRGRAERERATARPAARAPLEEAVAAVGGLPFDASTLRVRGLPMFGSRGGRRFQRYIDQQGAVRIYYFPNTPAGTASYNRAVQSAINNARTAANA
jgi:ParB/RepB/Spo0J family partition protein